MQAAHQLGTRGRLQSRFRAAFLGCALGDAIGRPFEMMSAGDRRLLPALDTMFSRPGPWPYTDDTEMMISVAESLTRVGGVRCDDLLMSLATNYEPARGYGHGMRLALAARCRNVREGIDGALQDG
jgi:ADP-ribosylglycohydrolase